MQFVADPRDTQTAFDLHRYRLAATAARTDLPPEPRCAGAEHDQRHHEQDRDDDRGTPTATHAAPPRSPSRNACNITVAATLSTTAFRCSRGMRASSSARSAL